MEDILDWDAFERFEKRMGGKLHVPPGSVSVSKHGHLNLASFSSHFAEHGFVKILVQPTAMLLVPTDDSMDFTVSSRKSKSSSVSVQKLMRVYSLEQGYYPAEWVHDKGLLIDIRPRRASGETVGPSPKTGLEEVLD